MNILERLQERVLQKELEGTVRNTEQLRLFVTGYLQGVFDQYNEDYFCMTPQDSETIKAWVEGYYMKDYYFTFGSWERYPFQNGYIIVKAETIREAAYKFKNWFPNPTDEDVLNCSDYYNAEKWQEILDQGYYKDQEPLAVMQ